MTRQIATTFQPPSLFELDARLRGLEAQVADLREKLAALTDDADRRPAASASA
jgi:hypothetical protein